MANPNISAMAELNVGTLAWEIEQDGVALIWGNAYAMHNNISTSMRSDTLTPEIWTLRDGSYTLQNTMLLAYWGYDGNQFPIDSATYDSVAMTKVTNAHQLSNGASSASSDMAYILDANINHSASGQDPSQLRLEATWASGYNANYGATSASAYLANVDQTTPLSTNIRAGNPVWTQAGYQMRDNQMYDPIPTQIGDMVIVCWMGQYQSRLQLRNANSHVIGATVNTNATTYYQNCNNMSYISPRSYEEHIMAQVENGYPGQYSYGGALGQSNAWSVVNVQSPRTKTTLFTVPDGKMVKLNNLYIENPEISGLHVSIDIEGLPTGTTGILDSSDDKVIDSVDTIATTTICKMLKARTGKTVPAMKRPMILTEGDVVKAKVVADEAYPEWLKKKCQIIADFEIVQ
tara:strand:+ start:479 stop:1690 length:1212 start_codon:yes stop_codon:yes gene_type:complete